MIIGVDLDGVTGKYVEVLRTFVSNQLGIPEADRMTMFPEPIDYNFTNWPHVSEDFVKYHSEAVAMGLYKDMDVMEGASETLWRLNGEGDHLRVITSRFVKHGQNYKVVANTAEWLDKNDIPYRDIMFVRDKVDVFADVYIDDSPSNILNFDAAGRTVIIFDAPYNQGMAGLRAYTWDDVYKFICELKLNTP
jgi:5'(3')-deoxyribonucleotidase